MSEISSIIIPLLNPNEDAVQLVEWLVSHGDSVNPGDPICEVETSKAATELVAEQSGVIFQIAVPQSDVRVGERIGLIGPNLEQVQEFLATEQNAAPAPTAEADPKLLLRATPNAKELAAETGVTLEQVAAMGVRGTIKEADVRRYVSEHGADGGSHDSGETGALPATISQYVVDEGAMTRHELSVSRALRRSLEQALIATVDADVDLTAINPNIRLAQEQGAMVSLLHVVLRALGRSLPHFPRLMSIHYNQHIYRFCQPDVAFVVRTSCGRLYTPVVRGVDKLDVNQIARTCHALATQVNRGRIKPAELNGACFSVSHVPTPPVTRFVALPNQFQSAILALAADRTTLNLVDGQVTPATVATMTLSYDHTLCDGMYAADFLQRLINEMESAFV